LHHRDHRPDAHRGHRRLRAGPGSPGDRSCPGRTLVDYGQGLPLSFIEAGRPIPREGNEPIRARLQERDRLVSAP
jgi:hypothetical protein